MTPQERALHALRDARQAVLDWANTDRSDAARAALADVDAAMRRAATA